VILSDFLHSPKDNQYEYGSMCLNPADLGELSIYSSYQTTKWIY